MAFSPLGPIAGAFCLDNSEVACIMGPVGSGKTSAAILRLARHAFEQRPGPDGIARTRFAIIRNTGPQLQDTTLKSWKKVFPDDGRYRKWTSTTKTQLWRFVPKGMKHMIHAEFIFRALDDADDVANLLSLEVTGFWFNEFREISTDIFANSRARYGRFPGADQGGCTWRGAIADTNPWSFTSDFHEMFVADKRPGFAFFKQAGGLDAAAENVENLEQTQETLKLPWNDPRRREQGRTYYTRLLDTYSANDSAMYVHCRYGASRAGKPVYESYDDNTHCKTFELVTALVKGVERTPILIGYDNTGRTPAAIISQRTAAGQWRLRYEFIGEGMGMVAHAQALRRFIAEKIPNAAVTKVTCDPAGRAKGADDIDMRMIVQREFPGVTVVNARTNDIATRIAAVEGPLRRLVNGEPAVLIHPDCKILRSACLSKYQYRRMKIAGEERYTEEPDKAAKPYADIADAVQYLFLGGGEGRVTSEGGEAEMWGKSPAITPVAPDQRPKDDPRKWQGGPQQQRRPRQFNPFTGPSFNER
jgi:hypothetical protein